VRRLAWEKKTDGKEEGDVFTKKKLTVGSKRGGTLYRVRGGGEKHSAALHKVEEGKRKQKVRQEDSTPFPFLPEKGVPVLLRLGEGKKEEKTPSSQKEGKGSKSDCSFTTENTKDRRGKKEIRVSILRCSFAGLPFRRKRNLAVSGGKGKVPPSPGDITGR